jgi:hypothetical protein
MRTNRPVISSTDPRAEALLNTAKLALIEVTERYPLRHAFWANPLHTELLKQSTKALASLREQSGDIVPVLRASRALLQCVKVYDADMEEENQSEDLLDEARKRRKRGARKDARGRRNKKKRKGGGKKQKDLTKWQTSKDGKSQWKPVDPEAYRANDHKGPVWWKKKGAPDEEAVKTSFRGEGHTAIEKSGRVGGLPKDRVDDFVGKDRKATVPKELKDAPDKPQKTKDPGAGKPAPKPKAKAKPKSKAEPKEPTEAERKAKQDNERREINIKAAGEAASKLQPDDPDFEKKAQAIRNDVNVAKSGASKEQKGKIQALIKTLNDAEVARGVFKKTKESEKPLPKPKAKKPTPKRGKTVAAPDTPSARAKAAEAAKKKAEEEEAKKKAEAEAKAKKDAAETNERNVIQSKQKKLKDDADGVMRDISDAEEAAKAGNAEKASKLMSRARENAKNLERDAKDLEGSDLKAAGISGDAAEKMKSAMGQVASRAREASKLAGAPGKEKEFRAKVPLHKRKAVKGPLKDFASKMAERHGLDALPGKNKKGERVLNFFAKDGEKIASYPIKGGKISGVNTHSPKGDVGQRLLKKVNADSVGMGIREPASKAEKALAGKMSGEELSKEAGEAASKESAAKAKLDDLEAKMKAAKTDDDKQKLEVPLERAKAEYAAARDERMGFERSAKGAEKSKEMKAQADKAKAAQGSIKKSREFLDDAGAALKDFESTMTKFSAPGIKLDLASDPDFKNQVGEYKDELNKLGELTNKASSGELDDAGRAELDAQFDKVSGLRKELQDRTAFEIEKARGQGFFATKKRKALSKLKKGLPKRFRGLIPDPGEEPTLHKDFFDKKANALDPSTPENKKQVAADRAALEKSMEGESADYKRKRLAEFDAQVEKRKERADNMRKMSAAHSATDTIDSARDFVKSLDPKFATKATKQFLSDFREDPENEASIVALAGSRQELEDMRAKVEKGELSQDALAAKEDQVKNLQKGVQARLDFHKTARQVQKAKLKGKKISPDLKAKAQAQRWAVQELDQRDYKLRRDVLKAELKSMDKDDPERQDVEQQLKDLEREQRGKRLKKADTMQKTLDYINKVQPGEKIKIPPSKDAKAEFDELQNLMGFSGSQIGELGTATDEEIAGAEDKLKTKYEKEKGKLASAFVKAGVPKEAAETFFRKFDPKRTAREQLQPVLDAAKDSRGPIRKALSKLGTGGMEKILANIIKKASKFDSRMAGARDGLNDALERRGASQAAYYRARAERPDPVSAAIMGGMTVDKPAGGKRPSHHWSTGELERYLSSQGIPPSQIPKRKHARLTMAQNMHSQAGSWFGESREVKSMRRVDWMPAGNHVVAEALVEAYAEAVDTLIEEMEYYQRERPELWLQWMLENFSAEEVEMSTLCESLLEASALREGKSLLH